jgi:hypothetical protein
MPNFGLSSARSEASRRNGAKSRGPKTPEGAARSSLNALKHGLRAQRCVVLPGERASAFDALKAALLEELGKGKNLRNEPNHVAGILAKLAWRDAERYGSRGEIRADGVLQRARSGTGAAETQPARGEPPGRPAMGVC